MMVWLLTNTISPERIYLHRSPGHIVIAWRPAARSDVRSARAIGFIEEPNRPDVVIVREWSDIRGIGIQSRRNLKADNFLGLRLGRYRDGQEWYHECEDGQNADGLHFEMVSYVIMLWVEKVFELGAWAPLSASSNCSTFYTDTGKRDSLR